GSWPSTLTPVRTSIPRFLNERATTLTTSASQPGSSFGSASSSVTWVPRSLIIEANSQPMAPPPITATDEGNCSSISTSSDVITYLPSTSKPGRVRGTDPVAMMTLLALSSVPSSTFTSLFLCSV